ncbi:hypothetical protein ACFS5M_13825 [Lacinutrix iliipiscaria]|uniref:Uncharacterized protein n=1 Tax=Lacinutrix iliipiscaria TaxID=1230532 RepID=A0ABW5WTZ1_9FLAO
MKNLKLVSVFFLSFFLFTITSCDNEPLEGEFATDDGSGGGGASTCAEATTNVANATAAYSTVSPTDSNFTEVCNEYLAALQDFLDLCGDTTGAIQATIDSLDCSSDVPDDCPTAEAATDSAEAAYNADTSNATLCNAYINALENEIAVCGDSSGELQAIIDGLSCASDTQDYWPRAIGNSWTYNTFFDGEQIYEISGTETIDGFEYYAFDELFANPTWLRKSGVNYLMRSEISGSIPGYQFASTPFIINMIKEDATIGETWESDVSYTISYTPETGSPDIPDADVDALYSFEMIERDITRTVEGVNYTDVIHIELTVTALGTTDVSHYYYANHIGMIEYLTNSGSNTLLEYTLN